MATGGLSGVLVGVFGVLFGLGWDLVFGNFWSLGVGAGAICGRVLGFPWRFTFVGVGII